MFAGELKGVFRAANNVGRFVGDGFAVMVDGTQARLGITPKQWVFGDYIGAEASGKRQLLRIEPLAY